MNHSYLSPAFTKHTNDELEFLHSLDGATGFSLFWIDITRPVLRAIEARHLLEIGADTGEHTYLLLQYCDEFDADLAVIEPFVKPSLQKITDTSNRVNLMAEKSLAAIPNINSPIDAVLLEGDLNYFSVYSDLLAIRDLSVRRGIPIPCCFFRSSSWPYARRDMYYDPDTMPPIQMHDYAPSGMTPWLQGLEEGMINFPFFNAKNEGGGRNGVLTAVEDFIKESGLPLGKFLLPINNGVGIIYLKGSQAEKFIETNLMPPPALYRFLETIELARLNEIVRRLKLHQTQRYSIQYFQSKFLSVCRKLSHLILERTNK
ncbi:MAG: class I SAM-dependent methyltransferase [Deltaproteobacteria bacterium]